MNQTSIGSRRAERLLSQPTRTVLWLLMTLWLVAATAQSEDKAVFTDPVFIDRVDVNVINVEVFVTDKDGQRVTGLTQDDFEILEDGVPVEITNFYATTRSGTVDRLEEDRRLITGETADLKPEAEPSPAIDPANDLSLPNDQRLSLAVYVDNSHIKPQGRAEVLRHLGNFIEDRVRQGDRVALLSQGLTVRPVVPFTDDVVALAQGVEEISKEVTYGQATEALRRRVLRAIEYQAAGEPSPTGDAAADAIRSFAQQQAERSERSMKALQRVLKSLSGLPGRKALLYVSDGVPQSPGADLHQYYIDRIGAANSGSIPSYTPISAILQNDQTALLNRVVREANAGQVTVYTMQALGAKPRSSVSAEYAPAALTSRGDTLSDALNLQNLQEPMMRMAEATGGEAILNTSNFGGAFENISKDFDSLYSLGYPSRRGGDGKFHKIEVRTKREGLKVRHRAGYVDKPELERVADRTYSSLILDLESNPLGISIDFGEPEKAGRGKFHLPLLVRIPFDGITLLPNGANHEGRLKIHLVVQDEKGGVSDLQEIPYPVTVPATSLGDTQGKEMGYAGKLLVRNGVPKVAIGVWDEVSGLESFVHKSVEVGKQKKKRDRGRG